MPDLDDAPQPGGADEAALAIVARHALHDEELVAAFAASALSADDDADDEARARSLVDRCPACRALRDDVAAIAQAGRASAAFTATAPRDFRLTVEDAHRLGGTVVTRGAFAAFRRLLLGVARPVGASMAALGLVGVLVGSAMFGAGGVASGPGADSATSAGGASSVPAAAAPSTFEVAAGPAGSPKASDRIELGPAEPGRDATAPTAWLLIVSVAAVLGGLGLFLIGTRVGARRGSGAGDH